MTRVPQHGGGVGHRQVEVADHLVKVVQPAARSFEPLERLGELAERLHGCVVDTRRPLMGVVAAATRQVPAARRRIDLAAQPAPRRCSSLLLLSCLRSCVLCVGVEEWMFPSAQDLYIMYSIFCESVRKRVLDRRARGRTGAGISTLRARGSAATAFRYRNGCPADIVATASTTSTPSSTCYESGRPVRRSTRRSPAPNDAPLHDDIDLRGDPTRRAGILARGAVEALDARDQPSHRGRGGGPGAGCDVLRRLFRPSASGGRLEQDGKTSRHERTSPSPLPRSARVTTRQPLRSRDRAVVSDRTRVGGRVRLRVIRGRARRRRASWSAHQSRWRTGLRGAVDR